MQFLAVTATVAGSRNHTLNEFLNCVKLRQKLVAAQSFQPPLREPESNWAGPNVITFMWAQKTVYNTAVPSLPEGLMVLQAASLPRK